MSKERFPLAIRIAKIIKADRGDELTVAKDRYANPPFAPQLSVKARLQSAQRRSAATRTLENRWWIKL